VKRAGNVVKRAEVHIRGAHRANSTTLGSATRYHLEARGPGVSEARCQRRARGETCTGPLWVNNVIPRGTTRCPLEVTK
jgi:hypothetical protein